jgi:hypothetical protein
MVFLLTRVTFHCKVLNYQRALLVLFQQDVYCFDLFQCPLSAFSGHCDSGFQSLSIVSFEFAVVTSQGSKSGGGNLGRFRKVQKYILYNKYIYIHIYIYICRVQVCINIYIGYQSWSCIFLVCKIISWAGCHRFNQHILSAPLVVFDVVSNLVNAGLRNTDQSKFIQIPSIPSFKVYVLIKTEANI